MITIQISHFIFFIAMVIISTIIVYEQLFPGRIVPPKIRRINICKKKIKYIPVYILDKNNKQVVDGYSNKQVVDGYSNKQVVDGYSNKQVVDGYSNKQVVDGYSNIINNGPNNGKEVDINVDIKKQSILNTNKSSNNIGIHSSAHTASIVPSIWNENENENNYDFEY
jgi:hypothetical protein